MKSRNTSSRKNARFRNALRLESLERRVVFSGASPIAVNDLYEALVDEPLQVETGGVLANDIDAESDALSAEAFFTPKHGQLSFNEDGTFEYQPDPGFVGTDGFVYQVDDGSSKSQLAAVTIQVTDPNDAPVGENDFYATTEDSILEVLAENGVLVNDSDKDGDTLVAELIDAPEHGVLTLGEDGSFTFAPDANFHGTDAFTYRLSDGELTSDLVVVELSIESVNDAPLGAGETYELAEDATLVAETSLLSNDQDVDGDSLEVLLESGPDNGTLELHTDGTFTYTPNANFHGTDTIEYRVSDGTQASELIQAEIQVNAVNDLPVAENDFLTMEEDGILEINLADGLLANDFDIDGDDLSFELVDAPEYGELIESDAGLQFTPDTDFYGVDAFTYRVDDGSGQSDLAVVEIMVLPVNDAPVAVNDAYEMDAGQQLVMGVVAGESEDGALAAESVLANDTDVDGDMLTLMEMSAGPEHGTLEIGETGALIYTPDADYSGVDSFSYMVSDGLESSTATVQIQVNPVAVALDANNESYSAVAGETLTVDADAGVLDNDTGTSGSTEDPLDAILFRGPNHGVLELRADGSFDYTPEAEFEGIDSFIYRATEGEVESRLAVVTLYVSSPTPVIENAPPESIATDEPTATAEPEDVQDDAQPFRERVDNLFGRLNLDDLWFEVQCFFS